MPFLGKTPAQGFVNSVTKDDFTPNGTTTAFTLSKAPATVNELEVYVGNVRQEPTDAYSVSGTTLTMTEAPATGTNFYVMHIGGTTQSSTTLPGGSTVPGDFNVSGDSTVLGQIAIGTTTINRDIHISTARPDIRLTDTTDNTYSEIVYNVGKLSVQVDPDQTSSDSAFNVKIDDTTRIRVDSNGLLFGSDTAAANALNDYEEGTWTPVYDNVTAPTYQAQTGKYIKIGKIVHVTGTITCTGLDTSDGSAVIITGFPFNIDTANEAMNFNLGRYSSQLNGEEVDLVNVRATSTGAMLLRSSNSSLSYNSGINTGGTLQFAATYHATS